MKTNFHPMIMGAYVIGQRVPRRCACRSGNDRLDGICVCPLIAVANDRRVPRTRPQGTRLFVGSAFRCAQGVSEATDLCFGLGTTKIVHGLLALRRRAKHPAET